MSCTPYVYVLSRWLNPSPVGAVVAEYADGGQARRANHRELLLRRSELRVGGANVGPRSHRDVDRRRFIRRAGQRKRGERVGELQRRVERQIERAQEIEPRRVRDRCAPR